MQLCLYLQKQRDKAGLDRDSAAAALGIEPQLLEEWESGQSRPELEQLLELARLYGCGLDDMIKAAPEPARPPELREMSSEELQSQWQQDFREYRRERQLFTMAVSAGVALILIGLTVLLSAHGHFPEILLIAQLIFLTGAAVFLFICFGMRFDSFREMHYELHDLFDPAETRRFRHIFAYGLGGAVALILIGAGLMVLVAGLSLGRGTLGIMVMMICVTIAVPVIIWLAMTKAGYDIEAYNRENHPATKKKSDNICSSIMLLATALYLIMGFVFHRWHPGWVVFPVGGILCAIVSSVMNKDH